MAGMRDWYQQAAGQGAKAGADAFEQASDSQSKLAQLIKGKQMDASNTQAAAAQQNAYKTAAYNTVKEDAFNAAKHNTTVKFGNEGASASVGEKDPAGAARQDAADDRARAKLSEKYAKLAPFTNDMQEIEHLTDTDGKGGILTNPGATIPGSGKILSGVPDIGIGIAGLVSPEMAKASQVRKALARLRLDYANSVAGVRGASSPDFAKREADALGNVVSGDPNLQAKALRSLGRGTGLLLKTHQAGYNDLVKDAVHNDMGNPADFFSRIPEDPSGASLEVPTTPEAPPDLAAPEKKTSPGGAHPDPAKEARRQELLKKSQLGN